MFRLYYLAVDMVAPVLLLPLGFFLYGSWKKYPAQKTWIYLLFALYPTVLKDILTQLDRGREHNPKLPERKLARLPSRHQFVHISPASSLD